MKQSLVDIREGTEPMFKNLAAADAMSKKADGVWAKVREFETQPVPSENTATVKFLNFKSRELEKNKIQMKTAQDQVPSAPHRALHARPTRHPATARGKLQTPVCLSTCPPVRINSGIKWRS